MCVPRDSSGAKMLSTFLEKSNSKGGGRDEHIINNTHKERQRDMSSSSALSLFFSREESIFARVLKDKERRRGEDKLK